MNKLDTERDPPIFETRNLQGKSALLLVCDHAGNAIPKSMDNLGISEEHLKDHIAWDIGARRLTRRMSYLLDAPAILTLYSRLLIDCNRPILAPDLVPEFADGIEIPGNTDLSEKELSMRQSTFYDPYHLEIEKILDKFSAYKTIPILVSMHSFAPFLSSDRECRPWEISICWDCDNRLATPFISSLKSEGFCVGENQPYGFDELSDFTIPEHGLKRGIPHILIEVRNDQIRDEAGIENWSQRLTNLFRFELAHPENLQVKHFGSSITS